MDGMSGRLLDHLTESGVWCIVSRDHDTMMRRYSLVALVEVWVCELGSRSRKVSTSVADRGRRRDRICKKHQMLWSRSPLYVDSLQLSTSHPVMCMEDT